MNQEKKDVICIIGMHRSGTSMVARLLNLSGLDLGPHEKLVSSLEGNPRGHWENVEFLRINNELLARLGGTWDNPPKLIEGWQDSPALSDLYQEARVFVRRDFSKSTGWGWKEPRTTLVVPFWKKVIDNLKFVIVVRNVLSVARSLEKRDGIPIREGSRLWFEYMVRAVMDTEKCPRIFTFYDDYLTNPAIEVKRLSEFCGLDARAFTDMLQEIDVELPQHQNTLTDLLGHPDIPEELKACYFGLQAFSDDHLLKRSSGNVDRSDFFAANIQVFFEVFRTISNRLSLVEKTQIRDEDLPMWANELEKTINQQQKALADQKEWVFQLQTKIQQLHELVSIRDEQASIRDKQLSEAQRLIAEISGSISWRYTKPLRLFKKWLLHWRSSLR